MSDELVFLRVLVVTRSELPDLFREAAASLTVPIEVLAAADVAAVQSLLGLGADLVYIDGALPLREIASTVAALEAATKPPFSILLATGAAAVAFATEGVAGKPTRVEEARWLLERSMRVRLPSRTLVVDDSTTMRAIVRKALAATRFPFQVSEAEEGLAALILARGGGFDLVFLDYNMPGFSGLQTLSEFKREKLRVNVVMITSTRDEGLAKRARELGAAFLKKPFYAADIENVLCGYYGLRALQPSRV